MGKRPFIYRDRNVQKLNSQATQKHLEPKQEKQKKDDSMYTKKNRDALVLRQPGQEYGEVTKLLGNMRVSVFCFDGETRMCIIRKTMKRKKMYVKINDIVLITLRDFQTEKADVIWVYTNDQVKSLIKMNEIPPRNHTASSDDEIVQFYNSEDEEEEEKQPESGGDEKDIGDVWGEDDVRECVRKPKDIVWQTYDEDEDDESFNIDDI